MKGFLIPLSSGSLPFGLLELHHRSPHSYLRSMKKKFKGHRGCDRINQKSLRCACPLHSYAFSFFLEIRVEANSYSPLSKRMIRLLDASHSAGDGFNERRQE